MIPGPDELSDAIEAASRRAFASLFSQHPGGYYYCSLVTTGEGHAPVVAAWSREALSAAVAEEEDPEAELDLKWSCSDSPYYDYGSQHFELVRELFKRRPPMTPELSDEQWEAELQVRLAAMVGAMSRLDSEGLFGTGSQRLRTVILVEVVPPDHTNTERAQALNPPEALVDWLEEAAEE